MSTFKPSPVLVLETQEQVREAIATQQRDTLFGFRGMDIYRIKSLWLIDLIRDIISANGRDFAYNADVKKLAEQRLGFPPKPEAEYSREGDVLSLLIYNAQCYRQSDELYAAGYVPFTEAMLAEAHQAQKAIVTLGGKTLKPRVLNGKLYAMEPRKRRYAVAAMGQPARFAEAC
jgi:hypothetical protein